MYNEFKGQKLPNLKSDKLRYNSALHKGLPNVIDALMNAGGQAGVVDYNVQDQVRNDNKSPKNMPPTPLYWTQPDNYPFGPNR